MQLVQAMRVIASPINDLIKTELFDDSLPLTIDGLEAYVNSEFGEDEALKLIRGAKWLRHIAKQEAPITLQNLDFCDAELEEKAKDVIKNSVYFAALYGQTYLKLEEQRYKDCKATFCDTRDTEKCHTIRQEDIDQETINYSWGDLTMNWGSGVFSSNTIKQRLGEQTYHTYYDYYSGKAPGLKEEVLGLYKWEIRDIQTCYKEADKLDNWMHETLFRKWMSDRLQGTIFG